MLTYLAKRKGRGLGAALPSRTGVVGRYRPTDGLQIASPSQSRRGTVSDRMTAIGRLLPLRPLQIPKHAVRVAGIHLTPAWPGRGDKVR